jgi:RNA-dependent RNA polymerase
VADDFDDANAPQVICFELVNPPIFEEFNFNRELRHDWADHDKFRRRVAALNERHAAIAPYAHHLRILLFNEPGEQDPLDSFIQFCRTAVEGGLRVPYKTLLEANKTEACFTAKRLSQVRRWAVRLHWDVAFQVELMLHNGLLNTMDILGPLKERIDKIHQEDEINAGFTVRRFVQALRTTPNKQTLLECFDRVLREPAFHPTVHASDGMVYCHHLTVTPSRFLLEGPYVVQSNRIIREYKGFESNFLRVDFRDEDRLSFRWDRTADGKSFLESRVGGILKNGLELAGRTFEFLAYSSSALRSHSVWFMTPFEHPERGFVTSNFIRSTLGSFKDELIKQPSKYAARLAQAFTATDPSVRITREQWDDIPDIGNGPSPHTDGCGTISPELGDQIWTALCANRSDHDPNAIKPSAVSLGVFNGKGRFSNPSSIRYVSSDIRAWFP